MVLFGGIVAIIAFVDFFRILFDKMLPADGCGWKSGNSILSGSDELTKAAEPSQHIIDSWAAIKVISG